MTRAIHFEIHAGDPERCREFYQALFDWQFSKWDGPVEYWTIATGDPAQAGINGGLLRRRGAAPVSGQPVNAYVITIDVANLDESLAKGQSLGGSVAVAKMAIPGIGWIAYMTDTEGNIFGMMQNDQSAT
jgi:predicted enzyme related to lactoylglutathione lyase